MKFSIIIPAYNEEKGIARCIESVLMQNYRDYEIIIVDDGSVDETREIAQSYSSRSDQIKVLCHEENLGLGAARNTGMRAAVGEYLLFLDADDYIVEDSLAEIAEAEGTQLILLTSCKIRDGHVQEEFRHFEPEDFAGEMKDVLPRLVEKQLFIGSACEKAVNREWAWKNEIFFPENRLKETISWCSQLLIHVESISYCNKDYYCYVQQGKGSLSGKIGPQSVRDAFISIEESAAWMEKQDIPRWRKQAGFLFLSGPMLFVAEYMDDFGTPQMKREEKRYLYLLKSSSEWRCRETWWILKLLGMELGSKVVCWRSKRRFAKKRKRFRMGE